MSSAPEEQAQPQPTITEQVHSLIVAVESLAVSMEAMQATIDHLLGADREGEDLEEVVSSNEEAVEEDEESVVGDDADDGEGAGEGNAFPSLEAWVVQWFSPVMARRMGTQVCWCREWWQHAEAGSRLQALWWAWEQARCAPGGDTALGWWLKLDQALVVLMGPTGPFAGCTPDRHSPPKPLPVSMPPPDWLDPLPDCDHEASRTPSSATSQRTPPEEGSSMCPATSSPTDPVLGSVPPGSTGGLLRPEIDGGS